MAKDEHYIPPIIDLKASDTIPELQDTINSLREKKLKIVKEMRTMARTMRRQEKLDMNMLDKYQDLNQKLRDVKIWEAEFVYTRNML